MHPEVWQRRSNAHPFEGLCQVTSTRTERRQTVKVDCCRGRDDYRWSPPAQIRTCAFTHTALTKDEWLQCRHQDKAFSASCFARLTWLSNRLYSHTRARTFPPPVNSILRGS